jgi:hypothetical protein
MTSTRGFPFTRGKAAGDQANAKALKTDSGNLGKASRAHKIEPFQGSFIARCLDRVLLLTIATLI